MDENKDGLIAAYILDGAGSGKPAGWEEIAAWKPRQGVLWVHLNYSIPGAQAWLYAQSGLDEVISDALTEEDSRPRCTPFHEGLLLGLRGVNLNPGADPEDMVGVRIWFEKDRIISTRRRKVLSMADIESAIVQGNGPDSLSDFLVQVTGRMMERMQQVIDDLEDAVAEVEDKVLTSENHELRAELAALRRQAISLRRYLSPQREALSRLLT
jgi:zinc transporter